MILHWEVRFRTPRPVNAFPRPLVVASESHFDTSYHWQGRLRQSEHYCLLQYTLEGYGIFCDASGHHRVPAGSGFLCEIRDPATSYYYPPESKEPWRFVYFCMLGECVREMVREMVRRYGPIYSLPVDKGIIPHLLAYQSYDGVEVDVTSAGGAHLCMDLLGEMVDSREGVRPVSSANAMVRNAREAIGERLTSNLSVKQLAGLMGVSREHLTRVFREHVAITPHEYILRQKMLLACRWLKETTMTGKDISARLGYDEPAHFTRTFKRMLKMTPSRFRAVGFVPVM